MKHGLAIALAACLTVVGGISLGYSFTMNTDADTVSSEVQEASEQALSDITETQDQIAKEALHVRDEVKRLREEAAREWADAKAQFEKELLGEV